MTVVAVEAGNYSAEALANFLRRRYLIKAVNGYQKMAWRCIGIRYSPGIGLGMSWFYV